MADHITLLQNCYSFQFHLIRSAVVCMTLIGRLTSSSQDLKAATQWLERAQDAGTSPSKADG